MLRPIDEYFLKQEEPEKSILLFLRQYILNFNPEIEEVWQYKMPFYTYREKRFCYLWLHKKHKQAYLGIVEGAKINRPELISEKRSRMKIYLIDHSQDIQVAVIKNILDELLALHVTI